MAEFDLSALMKDVSYPDTDREQIEYIPIDRIDPDPDNFYSLEGIDELAGSIEMVGLQQPLRLRPAQGGRYTVVSGHRRRAAVLLIIDGGSDQFAGGVPCIVERDEASPAMRELRLILANADTRKMTSADQNRQAERVEALIVQLEDEGFEFPGRLRDWVAKISGMSRSKLARLHAIRVNLAPGLLEFYNKGEINEAAAYELQKLPPEGQEAIAESCRRGGAGFITSSGAEHCVKYAERYMAPCRCGDGAECDHHARRFVQPLREQYVWARCTGECCLSCHELEHCKTPCKKGRANQKLDQEAKKTIKAKDKAREEREKAERQARFRVSRQAQALRVIPLIEAAGLDDGSTLRGRTYYQKLSVSDIRKAAAGDFGSAYFYEASMLPTDVEGLTEWADALDCSLDYLAGRTDTPELAGNVSDSDTGVPAGIAWHRTTPEDLPPTCAPYGSAILLWGDGGLSRTPDALVEMTINAMPESARWWAVIDGPKEDEE